MSFVNYWHSIEIRSFKDTLKKDYFLLVFESKTIVLYFEILNREWFMKVMLVMNKVDNGNLLESSLHSLLLHDKCIIVHSMLLHRIIVL